MSDGVHRAALVDRLDQVPATDHLVTIGTFDGVHRGHRYLLESAAARAGALSLPLLTVTFEPVPAMVLHPDRFPGRLCGRDAKLALLGQSGADRIAVLPFTPEFSRLSAEEFTAELVAKTRPRELWVGEAFALGRDRAGDVSRLRDLGQALGYRIEAVPRLEDASGVISSSAIRRLILDGAPERAAQKLGRLFRIEGEVIHGAHLGRTIGFPTANVVPPSDLVSLPDGIYASYADLPTHGSSLPAMTYIGTRPALNTGARLFETHVLDFDGDLYGQWIGVEMVSRLRGDATFASVEELIAQLHADEAAARAVFRRHGVSNGVAEAPAGVSSR